MLPDDAAGAAADADTNPLDPAEKHAAAVLLGLRDNTLDGDLRVITGARGVADGAATYTLPERPEQLARLGGVVLAPGGDLRQLYRLVRGVARAMVAAGHARGYFELTDAALLRELHNTFVITAEPIAWVPRTPDAERDGVPPVAVAWRVEVDLADALAQLDVAIG